MKAETDGKSNLVVVAAGSVDYPEAAGLVIRGALRSGANRVIALVPGLVSRGLESLPGVSLKAGHRARLGPSETGRLRPYRRSVLIIGSGLSGLGAVPAFVKSVIGYWQGPMVVDGDALRLIALRPGFHQLLKGQTAIVTPNRQELDNFALGESQPEAAARKLARQLGAVVLLKGDTDVITDGRRIRRVGGGSSKSDVRGAGDLLAGVLAGRLASTSRPFKSAVAASQLMRRASNQALSKGSRLAVTDVLGTLPVAATPWIAASLAKAGLPPPGKMLERLRAPDGSGVYASDGPNFRAAVFGRDSLEAAEDMLDRDPSLAESVLLTLASLQGRRRNLKTEEEPGKILHEYRRRTIAGRSVPVAARRKLDQLAASWGGTSRRLVYYGSVDATPLFIRLAVRFVDRYGPGLLERPVGRGRQSRPFRQSILAAVGLLEHKLSTSRSGLLEYHRLNPHGLINQSWKDSPTGYVHADGSLPNLAAPIAATGVQGLACDALEGAARWFEHSHPANARRWRALAAGLRKSFIARCWMPREEFFAAGLDYGPDGRTRRIETWSSDAGLVLDSGILDGHPRQSAMVNAVTRRLLGPEFLTAAGVRGRARRHADLVGFADYHGSWAVWPKETLDIARGLRRQGRPELASRLEARLVAAVCTAGSYAELCYVDPDGTVLVDQAGAPDMAVGGIPEPNQAWTVSALAAVSDVPGSRRSVAVQTRPVRFRRFRGSETTSTASG